MASFSLASGRPSLGGRSLAKAIATTKEVYSFPILEADEIADVLREMGAAVGEGDFDKPKPDTFRTWCELFVLEVLGIGKDELYVAHAAFADALDGADELHEASVPIVHFIRNMCGAARARRRRRRRRRRARPHARAPRPSPAQEQGARGRAVRRGPLAARPHQARARARAARPLGAHQPPKVQGREARLVH